jgi:hypothetical protein
VQRLLMLTVPAMRERDRDCGPGVSLGGIRASSTGTYREQGASTESLAMR